MDIQLVIGPNNSGKSLFAENLITESSDEHRIYLATMIPQTHENHKRIQKHILQRADKNFQTIEEPWDIHLIDIPKNSSVLLEDASNLLANGIFIHHSDYHECLKRILALAKKCKKLVIVSIDELKISSDYDSKTNDYIEQLHSLNILLQEKALYTKFVKKDS